MLVQDRFTQDVSLRCGCLSNSFKKVARSPEISNSFMDRYPNPTQDFKASCISLLTYVVIAKIINMVHKTDFFFEILLSQVD